MGQLLVTCRKCGALYPSGIIIEFESIRKQDRLEDVTTKCPFCEHENITNTRHMRYTVAV